MAKHHITDSITGGYPTVTLSCADSATETTFVPTLGMIGCSLRHHGAELLGQRGGLQTYAQRGSTMGIPLLHPWANRLSGLAYTVGGRSVRLDPQSPLLHRDANGLPMHGLLAAYRSWRIATRAADDDHAHLSAVLDFGADAALLAAFPFPHTLTLDVTLRGTELSIATTLQPSADVAVPASFGFHPYLQLPGVARANWHIEAPVRRRLRLDARGIPTGESEPVAIEPGALGDRTFDDAFTDLDRPAIFVLAGGGRRVTVRFDDGYRFAQVFAPAGEPLISFEPMTAPANALVSGDGLTMVEPGDVYRAVFWIAADGRL
jgi:aldose 1-epimerase